MDVSEVSASTTEAIVPPLTPPETAKSLTAETTRSCLMDETICNAMTADASMCRVSGCSEPSILLDEGDVGELNRLDRPDTMPTDQQGEWMGLDFRRAEHSLSALLFRLPVSLYQSHCFRS